MSTSPSPLEVFFDARTEGPGIWKWRHYFDAYHRHFAPLRGNPGLSILEIGIYSGGSLDMWRDYFGAEAMIYGVDIQPACQVYEQPGTKVIIGDQGDTQFWERVIGDGTLPMLDIVIDDGGHSPEQQRVTMTALLPRVKPGGVYVCEDVHGVGNPFAAHVSTMADRLNDTAGVSTQWVNHGRQFIVQTNSLQSEIAAVHLYPYLVVIEKRPAPLAELIAPRHGSHWQPFIR